MRIDKIIDSNRKSRVLAGSLTGIVFSVISVLFSFVLRTVFIKEIGIEYVGLFSFLSELIGLLVAVDGGICSSLFIKIHKPIAKNDIKAMSETFKLIRLVYSLRSVAVFLVGMILFLFLPYLADDMTIDMAIIKRLYLIYLILNAASYLLIFYEFVLEAFQKRYLTNLIIFIVTISFTIINIVCIYIYKNITLYIIITATSQIVTFTICDLIVRRKYHYLYSYDRSRKVDISQLKDMLKITYYTLAIVLVKNTDNILVTKFLGFRITGLYATYKMLNGQVFNLIAKVKFSAQDSTRNYIASNEHEDSVTLIYRLTYLYFWIGGFCSICLICLSTPFIELWLGDNYILPIVPIFLTVLTLFIDTLIFPMDDAFYSTETYRLNRTIPILEVGINLGVSIALGYYLGISGIMLGTLAYLIYKTIVRSHYMFYEEIGISNKQYIVKILIYTTVFMIGVMCTYGACMIINGETVISFVYKTIVCCIIPVCVFIIMTIRMEEFAYFKHLIYNFVNSRIQKNDRES